MPKEKKIIGTGVKQKALTAEEKKRKEEKEKREKDKGDETKAKKHKANEERKKPGIYRRQGRYRLLLPI